MKRPACRRRLKIDLGLARGLDYYTGVVFETTVNGWEKFGSIASGGRYDNLASLFTDRRLPGVGASIGLDRLLALMEEAGWLQGRYDDRAGAGGELPGHGSGVSVSSWPPCCARWGIGAEVFPDPLQIGKQMGYGSTRGHKFAVIVGPDEREAKKSSTSATSPRGRKQKGDHLGPLEETVQAQP